VFFTAKASFEENLTIFRQKTAPLGQVFDEFQPKNTETLSKKPQKLIRFLCTMHCVHRNWGCPAVKKSTPLDNVLAGVDPAS
jgi:hypothetical protein